MSRIGAMVGKSEQLTSPPPGRLVTALGLFWSNPVFQVQPVLAMLVTWA